MQYREITNKKGLAEKYRQAPLFPFFTEEHNPKQGISF